jgi:hypothetical protein
MKRWPVVCVFAWAVAAAVAADAPLSELASPDTKVTIGIDVRRLLDSPLLASEIGAAEREAAAKLAATGNLAGFDPLKDVDQAWVLVTNPNDQSSALVVLRGRFDVERLARGAKRYKDVPMVEAGTGAGGVIGLVSGQTALVGETAQVQAAIDRLGSAHMSPELQERIATASSRYDVWGIGEIPDGLPISPAGTPGPGSIDRFMFGLALRQGLALTAEIHTRSTEDAAKFTALLSMIDAAVKAQNKEGGATFDVQSDNGTFRIALTVPEDQVRKAIAEQRAAVMAALSQNVPGGSVKTDAKPAAPQPAPAAAPAPTPAPQPAAAPAPAPPAALLISPQPASVATPPAGPQPPAPAPMQIVKAPDGDAMVVKLPGAK